MALSLVARMNKQPEECTEALPCPFCGSTPFIQFWHGGRPSKRLISCSSCAIGPGVTGETKAEALDLWNMRK